MKNIFRLGNAALFVLYALSFIFTFSSSLPSYVSSTFLAGFSSEQAVGIIYMAAAAATIAAFLAMPTLFRWLGNYRLTLSLAALTCVTLFGVAFAQNPFLVVTSFVISYAASTMMSLCLDVFIQHYSDNADTGRIRSTNLTAVNLAWLVSPWLSALLVGTAAYWKTFFAAAVVMIPTIFLVIYNFRSFKDPVYTDVRLGDAANEVEGDVNLRSIAAVSFLLNIFFASMIIYTPIYLHTYVGFSWADIGVMFTIMLIPFVLVQLPAGELADLVFGEKELLALGFAVMAVSTVLIPFIHGRQLVLWAAILFVTRIGAAIVQAMADTYFFKHVGEKNVGAITVYRLMPPVAYVLGPLLAIVFLLIFPMRNLFFLVAFLMLFGIGYSVSLRDTR
ncbi:MAG: MFS transporter [Patescibacteria group bacterium]|nr:MFS transporter [Patescibacteria group bacterium]MDE1946205.1 MFS transporter [Patescibacteria group bacterium]